MHTDDPARLISHETIYAAIYAQPKGGLKAEMIAALRQHKPARGLRRTTLAGGSIAPESLRIIHRPEEIEGRLVPGHWEGDLIKGAFNRSAVGTVVERKTRFVILSKMRGCTAEAALEGFTRQMKRLPAVLRRSMTYDRGSEMACHPELARRLKIDIWFCDPHAPRPRGSNENTNGQLAPVLPQRHRPEHHQPDRTQRRRPPDEPATPQDPRMENTRRSHGRRTRGLQINRCT
jgi:IS30 family transposase